MKMLSQDTLIILNRKFVRTFHNTGVSFSFQGVTNNPTNIPSGVAGQLISTPYSTQCTVYTKRQQRLPLPILILSDVSTRHLAYLFQFHKHFDSMRFNNT